MDNQIAATIAKFMRYSLDDIGYNYNELTEAEKTLCSKDEFVALVEWVKTH
jgi:hypothetical protein